MKVLQWTDICEFHLVDSKYLEEEGPEGSQLEGSTGRGTQRKVKW